MILFTKLTSVLFPAYRKSVCKFGALALAAMVGHSQVHTAFAASSLDIDRAAFLSAIAEVETGGDTRAVGRNGERGLYQFRSGVWKEYTKRSFFQAHNPEVAYNVAVMHYEWLHEGFVRNGRRPTVYMMAAAWNSGLNRTLTGRLSRGTRSYAERVANIVTVSTAQQVAWADAPRFQIRTVVD